MGTKEYCDHIQDSGGKTFDKTFEEGRIHFQNTVVQSTVVVERERTKNKKSRRTLLLISEMEGYLHRLKQEQQENQFLLGPGFVRNDFVWARLFILM